MRIATDRRLIAAGVTHVARWHSEAGTLHLRDALTAAGVRWRERPEPGIDAAAVVRYRSRHTGQRVSVLVLGSRSHGGRGESYLYATEPARGLDWIAAAFAWDTAGRPW